MEPSSGHASSLRDQPTPSWARDSIRPSKTSPVEPPPREGSSGGLEDSPGARARTSAVGGVRLGTSGPRFRCSGSSGGHPGGGEPLGCLAVWTLTGCSRVGLEARRSDDADRLGGATATVANRSGAGSTGHLVGVEPLSAVAGARRDGAVSGHRGTSRRGWSPPGHGSPATYVTDGRSARDAEVMFGEAIPQPDGGCESPSGGPRAGEILPYAAQRVQEPR